MVLTDYCPPSDGFESSKALVSIFDVKGGNNTNDDEGWKDYGGNQQRINIKGKTHRYTSRPQFLKVP